jgi:hypothetical protein
MSKEQKTGVLGQDMGFNPKHPVLCELLFFKYKQRFSILAILSHARYKTTSGHHLPSQF